MCVQHSVGLPPIIPSRVEDFPAWLRNMAAWEANRPENIKARHKRKKWRRIHDYAANRFCDSTHLERFWYSVMMRAKAYEAEWQEDRFWRQEKERA